MSSYENHFKQNLRIHMKKMGLSQTDLAKQLDVSNASVSQWLAGIKFPRPQRLEQIAKLFNRTVSDLMRPASTHSPNNVVSSSNYHYIPEGVSAGSFTTMEALDDIPSITIPDELMGHWAGKDVWIMHVNGDSMNRVIPHGSTIAIRRHLTWDDISDGDIIVAKLDGDYTMKHFYKIPEEHLVILRPNSHSPKFSDIRLTYEEAEGLELFGRVVMYYVSIE